jgi:stage III sporulation protein SpoIIIAA
VGRAIHGSAGLVADLVAGGASVLFMGRPGVGKTTAIRELSRLLADDLARRVVIVDTSNEIGGDGDVAHAGIGRARRMQVRRRYQQYNWAVQSSTDGTGLTVMLHSSYPRCYFVSDANEVG